MITRTSKFLAISKERLIHGKERFAWQKEKGFVIRCYTKNTHLTVFEMPYSFSFAVDIVPSDSESSIPAYLSVSTTGGFRF